MAKSLSIDGKCAKPERQIKLLNQTLVQSESENRTGLTDWLDSGQVGKVNMTNQSGCLPRYEDMTETRGKYGERRHTWEPLVPIEMDLWNNFIFLPQSEYIILINISKT